ncbi:hypothetical protein T484DRAFT_1775462 [Baffinella frigidus]|nr:hypothetical protein T484DRAFT_1775462 [Cryptophyta sp. CCMP2293]
MSMEGAVLAGSLAAEVVVDRAMGAQGRPDKNIIAEVHAAAEAKVAKDPIGVRGEGAIAFGGGAQFPDVTAEPTQQFTEANRKLMDEMDPAQLAA